LDGIKHNLQLPGSVPPDDAEPGSLPVEPDEGPVPTGIPEDPERGRMVEIED
jgi:hypothetical protein